MAVVDPAQVIADTEGAELGELEPVATAGGHEIASPHRPVGTKSRLIRSSVGSTRT